MVHRNGLRLAKLVNTLLDFSRIEAGRMRASYQPVDLAAVTAELASVFRSAIEEGRAELGGGLPRRCRSRSTSTATCGRRWCSTCSQCPEVHLRRLDHRPGGPPGRRGGAHPHRYRRRGAPRPRCPGCSSGSTASRTPGPLLGGSGIGLALVKELVGLHGGTIGATSTEGAGTTFTICLPIGTAICPPTRWRPGRSRVRRASPIPMCRRRCAGCRPTPGRYRRPARNRPGGNRFRLDPAHAGPVLVADDNTDMRDYLVRLLRGPDTRSRPSPTVAPPSKRSAPSFPTSSSAM